MIVTEQEAATKRCQESFGDGNVTPTGHMVAVHACGGAAYGIGTSPSMCIGSACMAWRWRGYRDQKGNIFNDAAPHGTGDTEHVGYCGKAGKP